MYGSRKRFAEVAGFSQSRACLCRAEGKVAAHHHSNFLSQPRSPQSTIDSHECCCNIGKTPMVMYNHSNVRLIGIQIPLCRVLGVGARQPSLQRSFTSRSALKAASSAASSSPQEPLQRETSRYSSLATSANAPGPPRRTRQELLSQITRRQPSKPGALPRWPIPLAQDSNGPAIDTPTARMQQNMISEGMNLPRKRGGDPAYLEQFTPTLKPIPAPLRLDAFVGRSEPVRGPGGLNAALRRMEIKCAINKVKSEHMRQKFHERPGLKRKRLRSERHRRRFKEAFNATVQKVQRMRSQGW